MQAKANPLRVFLGWVGLCLLGHGQYMQALYMGLLQAAYD